MNYTPEAEKIKWTYLATLDDCLKELSVDERTEMIESIQHHLDDAAHEFNTNTIDGTNMKAIINQVGDIDSITEFANEKTIKEIAQNDLQPEEEGSKAFTAQWTGTSHGYTFRVVNSYNLLLLGSATLFIDNKMIEKRSGWLSYVENIFTSITDDKGQSHSIRAYLGDAGFKKGVICRVWVDEQQIPMKLIEG